MKHLIFLFFLLLCSCITKNSSEHIKPTKIVKFMGVDMYSTDIDKQMFWSYPEEHMFMYMNKAGFLNDIESYKKEKGSSLKEYIYAFITPTDTLYSDYSLQSWILIRNKKENYYYDEEGKTMRFLKRTYPFFRDCPYTVENMNTTSKQN